jgi:hypothetical protein
MKISAKSLTAQPYKNNTQCDQKRSDQSLPAVAFSKPYDPKKRRKNNA